jgi:hypothetical protein
VELVVGGPAEDDMVGAFEGHDLKRDHIFAEIINTGILMPPREFAFLPGTTP